MSIQDIKRVSIRSYLAQRGIRPATEKPGSGMYLSPLRKEDNPSFNVDWNANLWHDFGTGEGGSIIDLVALMENCSVADAIRKLEANPNHANIDSLPERTSAIGDKSRIEILSVGELKHPALTGYLHERCIDLITARKYCNEVRYSTNGRQYFAIGFKNDAGGWELRNRAFKGSSTPKNITTINNGSDTVMVFEGFMDFLSYLSLKNNRRQAERRAGLHGLSRGAKEEGEANPSPSIDTTVLNSVANLQKAVPFLESHNTVHAFLDNDESGQKALVQMEKFLPKSEVVDQSKFYRNHKDVNDYLCNNKPVRKEKTCPVNRRCGASGEQARLARPSREEEKPAGLRKKGRGPKW